VIFSHIYEIFVEYAHDLVRNWGQGRWAYVTTANVLLLSTTMGTSTTVTWENYADLDTSRRMARWPVGIRVKFVCSWRLSDALKD